MNVSPRICPLLLFLIIIILFTENVNGFFPVPALTFLFDIIMFAVQLAEDLASPKKYHRKYEEPKYEKKRELFKEHLINRQYQEKPFQYHDVNYLQMSSPLRPKILIPE